MSSSKRRDPRSGAKPYVPRRGGKSARESQTRDTSEVANIVTPPQQQQHQHQPQPQPQPPPRQTEQLQQQQLQLRHQELLRTQILQSQPRKPRGRPPSHSNATNQGLDETKSTTFAGGMLRLPFGTNLSNKPKSTRNFNRHPQDRRSASSHQSPKVDRSLNQDRRASRKQISKPKVDDDPDYRRDAALKPPTEIMPLDPRDDPEYSRNLDDHNHDNYNNNHDNHNHDSHNHNKHDAVVTAVVRPYIDDHNVDRQHFDRDGANADTSRKTKLFHNIKTFHNQFRSAIAKDNGMLTFLESVPLGHTYNEACLDATVRYPREAKLQAVLEKAWRNFGYKGINVFREALPTCNDEMRTVLINAYFEFVEKLQSAYSRFITNVELQHPKATTEAVTAYWVGSKHQNSNKLKLGALNRHFVHIYLGDLERYAQQLWQTAQSKGIDTTAIKPCALVPKAGEKPRWSLCKKHYREASRLCPKNGKSYNQLALIAIFDEAPLDAVYFYARSLTVRQPILTARDALAALYEKLRKKRVKRELAEKDKQKRLKPKSRHDNDDGPNANHSNSKPISTLENTGERWTWILPEYLDTNPTPEVPLLKQQQQQQQPQQQQQHQHQQQPEQHPNCQNDTNIINITTTNNTSTTTTTTNINTTTTTTTNGSSIKSKSTVSSVEPRAAYKRFVSLFLEIHGVLFTKTGMDDFKALKDDMMAMFRIALSSASLSPNKLVQVILVNLFEVHNAGYSAANVSPTTNVKGLSPTSVALDFSLQMAFAISESILAYFTQCLAERGGEGLQKALACLPALGVFCDWLITYPSLWKTENKQQQQHHHHHHQQQHHQQHQHQQQHQQQQHHHHHQYVDDFWRTWVQCVNHFEHNESIATAVNTWNLFDGFLSKSERSYPDYDDDDDDDDDDYIDDDDDDVDYDDDGDDDDDDDDDNDGDDDDEMVSSLMRPRDLDSDSEEISDESDSEVTDQERDNSDSEQDQVKTAKEIILEGFPFRLVSAVRSANLEFWEDAEIRGFVHLEDATDCREDLTTRNAKLRKRMPSRGSYDVPTLKLAFRIARIVVVGTSPIAKEKIRVVRSEGSSKILFEFIEYAQDPITSNLNNSGRIAETLDDNNNNGNDDSTTTDDDDFINNKNNNNNNNNDNDDDDNNNDSTTTTDNTENNDDAATTTHANTSRQTSDSKMLELQERHLKLKTQIRDQHEDLLSRDDAIKQVMEQKHETGEIRQSVIPTHVFLDTNCFLDRLELVRKLTLQKKAFKVHIPMMVVNELYGLAKGATLGEERHNQDVLNAAATSAVHFLEEQFKSQHTHNMSAVTGAGNEMKTIAFRSETATREHDASNDDLILQSCDEFCSNHGALRKTLPDGSLVCKAALLTGDINLRVKAHTINFPVRTIEDFVKWARL